MNLSGVATLWLVAMVCLLPAKLSGSETVKPSHAPAVAVASSFRTLWPSLMATYETDTGYSRPRASFASSGLLSTQILHGAPFELFVSADLATVARLQQNSKAPDTGVSIARGGLSIVTRHRDDEHDPVSLEQLATALATSPNVTLAMPNPRHAPYGIAAQQALISAKLWPLPQGKLLAAENASQSLQYALSGAASFAIVPTTLVSPTPDTLRSAAVPDTLYDAVDHRAVLLATAGPAADAFVDWLQTHTAKEVLQIFGLSVQH